MVPVTRFLAMVGMVAIAFLTTPGLLLVWLAAPVLDYTNVRISDEWIELWSLAFWLTSLAVVLVVGWAL